MAPPVASSPLLLHAPIRMLQRCDHRRAQAKGVTLAAVSSQAQGAEDFRAAAWPAPVYLDEADAFKQALGSPNFSNWWLLKPSVIRGIISGSKYRRHLAPTGVGNPWIGYSNYCMAVLTDSTLH